MGGIHTRRLQEPSRYTHHHRAGFNVLQYQSTSADNRSSADGHALSYCCPGANVNAVSQVYDTAEAATCGHVDMVPNDAIVSQVAIGHK